MVFQAIGKYINPTRYRQIIETESATNLDENDQATLSKDQKHTSRVAKIHYQKVDSRNLAVKAKTCLEKLRDQRECTASLKRINCSTASNQPDFQERFQIEDCGRQKKVAFSETEDQFIREGIKKYGNGKWTAILNDPSYTFHPSRKACTLAVRVKNKNFM